MSCAHSLPTLDFSLTTRVAKKIVTGRQLAHGLSERSSGIRVQGYLRSGMLTETVGDEDGIGGGVGEWMTQNGMGRMIGWREHDDP